ncbi:MAG: DUF1028 domain-containing protein [Acetobacteraceae bacterium]|nr:DUF1028 domain-containing protein [Acetobacteraceae bacterium]
MTFTIAARCERTGQAGLAMATVSLAVGGLCPWFTSNGDVISSQAYASKRDGELMYRTMEAGKTASEALAVPKELDPDIDFRQLIVLPRQGNPIVFTGGKCRSWAGHIVGEHFITAGNVLAGQHVVTAMANAFQASDQPDLGERLLRALEAGRDAGGQTLPDGTALTERSASLCVLGSGADRAIRLHDLRVDMHGSAVHEMRRLYEVHRIHGAYAESRDLRPEQTPSMVVFEAEALRNGGVFASRPSCYR